MTVKYDINDKVMIRGQVEKIVVNRKNEIQYIIYLPGIDYTVTVAEEEVYPCE